jgi:hypothetical protein
MSDIRPINPSAHADHGWKRHTDMRFTEGDAWVPILLAEVSIILGIYPIAIHRPANGSPSLVALLGLQEGENLFVSPEGKWVMPYIPSHYRGYPFSLQSLEVAGKRRDVLCFDHQSGLYRENPVEEGLETAEERFFQESGDVSPTIAKLLVFLKKCARERVQTMHYTSILEQKQVLVDWDIREASSDGTALQDIQRVDMKAIQNLDENEIYTLQKTGVLELAYAQHFSCQRINILKDLHAQRKHPVKETRAPGVADQFFDYESDLLQFD